MLIKIDLWIDLFWSGLIFLFYLVALIKKKCYTIKKC